MLITVNGKLTAAELAAQLGKAGDVAAMLDQLLREQFVERALDPAARLKEARSELASLIVAALGPPGDEIAMRIESAKTLEALRDYLEARRAMLDGALGKRAAGFWAKAAALLGPE